MSYAIQIIILNIILYLTNSQAVSAQPTQQQIVTYINQYLVSLDKIAADFTQIDHNGLTYYGKLLLEKPHNFRCNYYPPYPLLIIGSKKFITLYDYELSQISRVSASENLLLQILTNEHGLNKNFTILDAYAEDNILVAILVTKDEQHRAHITIDNKHKLLQKIEIIDLNDNITTINFNSIKQVKSFDKNLFIIKNPAIFDAPARLDKQQLDKYIKY